MVQVAGRRFVSRRPGAVRERFVVYRVARGKVFLRVLQLFFVRIFPAMLITPHRHNAVIRWTNGRSLGSSFVWGGGTGVSKDHVAFTFQGQTLWPGSSSWTVRQLKTARSLETSVATHPTT